MKIKASPQPRLVKLLQIQTFSASNNLITVRDIIQSQNEKFLAFRMQQEFNLVLIENGEIMLQLRNNFCYYCFSDDSNYILIFYSNKEAINQLMLFNLTTKVIQWQIYLNLQNREDYGQFLFFKDSIVLLDKDSFFILTLNGQVSKLFLYDMGEDEQTIKRYKLQTKLSNQLSIYSLKIRYDRQYQQSIYNVFSLESYKNIKMFKFWNKYFEIVYFSYHLIILIPVFDVKDLLLKDIISNKILRKYYFYHQNEHFFKINKRSIINQKLYLLTYKNYYIINFLKGKITEIAFNFLPYNDIWDSSLLIQQPIYLFREYRSQNNQNFKNQVIFTMLKFIPY